jgi:hypothetical protein
VGIRTGRRLLARALATACLAGGLVGLSAAAATASDDYPWAWSVVPWVDGTMVFGEGVSPWVAREACDAINRAFDEGKAA